MMLLMYDIYEERGRVYQLNKPKCRCSSNYNVNNKCMAGLEEEGEAGRGRELNTKQKTKNN